MEANFSALKGYTDCKISFLNSKVDLFMESLTDTTDRRGKQKM